MTVKRFVFGAGVIFLIAGSVWWYLATRPQTTTPPINLPTHTATIGETTFTLYVTRSDLDRQRGLGNTRYLAKRHGMIFRGLDEGVMSLWMKDMYIPLDVIWVGKDDRIVYLLENISPESFPETYANPSDTPALYFIELNSGDIRTYGLSIGDQVVFAES